MVTTALDETLSDHVVAIGDSRVLRALASQESARSEVVHAGVHPLAAGIGARELPLGDDPEALHRAASSATARLVAIDLPSDAETVASLAALVNLPEVGARPLIVANIRDRALRRVVDENLFAMRVEPRPRLVSTSALAVHDAIAAVRPFDLAYWRGQARLHAVVIGFSTVGYDCFEELILAGIAGDLDRPRITILDAEPVRVRLRFVRVTPECVVSAVSAVGPFDPLTLTAQDGPLVAAAAEAPITLIVVALEDGADALSVMTSIARMQEGEGQAVASCLVVTERQLGLLALARPAGRARDLGRNWIIRGGIEDDPDILDLLSRRADELATRIHDTYCIRFGASGPAGVPWAALPETYRRANRRAADHLPVKLWTIGLREAGGSADPFSVDPHSHGSVVAPCAESTAEDALLRRLSRIEHDRWNAERRLDGWRFGEVRDDARRIHPKLIPFDDPRFTDEDIEKDADQVRFLFGHVVKPAPDGAVSPLVVGILAAAGEASGIDVEAAVALAAREPWRPVVVVCALVDGGECRILDALARALEREERPWRLVVPELSRDNRQMRAVIDEADKAILSAMLARPSTLFAPIGGIDTVEDLWADPSAPDPHAEALAAYVTERSAAIVDKLG